MRVNAVQVLPSGPRPGLLQLTAKSHLIAQRSLEVRDHQLMPGTSFNGCSIVSYVDEFRWS